jgi:hypothetical protein
MATFGSWLKDQSGRDDEVGQFAAWWGKEGDSRVHSPSGIEKRLGVMPGGEQARPAYLEALHEYQGQRIAETAQRHEERGRQLHSVPEPGADQQEQLPYEQGDRQVPSPPAEHAQEVPLEALTDLTPREPGSAQLDRIERKLDRLTAFMISLHGEDGLAAYKAVTEGVPAAQETVRARPTPQEALAASAADLLSRRSADPAGEVQALYSGVWGQLYEAADFSEGDGDAAGS